MNSNLNKARKQKNDEFYTLYDDVEKEVGHYWEHLRGKVVYCNCDDYRWSNFVKYFEDHFHDIGIKALVATNYDIGDGAYHYHWEGEGKPTVKPLEGGGSYDSPECLEILKGADVVITNPPFSLFREFIDCLIKKEKDFLVIGNFNAVTYISFFSLIKKERVGLGISPRSMVFFSPSGEVKVNSVFFTTLLTKRKKPIDLLERYYGNEVQYPKYDNYDAIEVGRVRDIPKDYFGVMGVPITYLSRHCPDTFKIVNLACRDKNHPIKTRVYSKEDQNNWSDLNRGCVVLKDGRLKPLYDRIFIQRRDTEQ